MAAAANDERRTTKDDVVFVGGTGRSGTHVVARLLDHHPRYHMIPIECRFHCNPNGLADVVTGKSTPEEFVAKLRRFWWHRVRYGGRALVRLRSLAGRGGKIRGLREGKTFSFLGIRYAEAERFAMPKAVGPWEGMKNAQVWGPESLRAGRRARRRGRRSAGRRRRPR